MKSISPAVAEAVAQAEWATAPRAELVRAWTLLNKAAARRRGIKTFGQLFPDFYRAIAHAQRAIDAIDALAWDEMTRQSTDALVNAVRDEEIRSKFS